MVRRILIGCAALAVFTAGTYVSADMQSGSYRILFDSVNSGGLPSGSTLYSLEDTVGEIASGDSSSDNYRVYAGYQQMNRSFISISSPSDVALPALNGLAGGFSTSSAAWNVMTDNIAGYQLTIEASTDPALRAASGASFPDYSPGADPSFTFSVASNASAFGMSPSGADITQRFKDDGVDCNTGSGDTAGACWDGLSTTPAVVASRSSSNHSDGGTDTTVEFRAESGNAHIQDSGAYSAFITVTAVTL